MNRVFTNQVIQFSGTTKSYQLQKSIESKVNVKLFKGIYGPEEKKSKIIIFIDDFNMPQKDKFGAQPPIELLR